MSAVNTIVAKAKTQIGVKESPANSNNVKYNTAYYGKSVSGDKYPWCCVFMWWVFKECGYSNLFYGGKKTASCNTLMNYYKKQKQFSTTPRIGSLAFFNWGTGTTAKHVGIVINANSDGTIVTVEGNTSAGNDSNGGQVMQRNRNKSQIIGYAYPYSNSIITTGGVCEVTLNQLNKGDKGNEVKALQILLNGYGYSCGAADGVFGSKTLTAVKNFQKEKDISVDGIVGTNTWSKLLK